MLFKFNDKTYFYFLGDMMETNDKGELNLHIDSIPEIYERYKDAAYDKQYGEMYRYLLNHQVMMFETIVTTSGNSGRIPFPPRYLGKRVKVWVAFLD